MVQAPVELRSFDWYALSPADRENMSIWLQLSMEGFQTRGNIATIMILSCAENHQHILLHISKFPRDDANRDLPFLSLTYAPAALLRDLARCI